MAEDKESAERRAYLLLIIIGKDLGYNSRDLNDFVFRHKDKVASEIHHQGVNCCLELLDDINLLVQERR